MIFYFVLAILAAFCWSISSLISADITRSIGGIAFNRLRLFFVSIVLILYATFISSWDTINNEYLFKIILSGIIGIFLGDTLLFVALQKIGPRRNNILFSLAAPFTVILNIFFLEESMTLLSTLGCFTVFFGVVIAIAYGSDNDNNQGTQYFKVIRTNSSTPSFFIGFFALVSAVAMAVMLSSYYRNRDLE